MTSFCARLYFKRLMLISAGIFLVAAQGTELSNDVFIIPIGLVVAKISPVEDEGRAWSCTHIFIDGEGLIKARG